MTCHLSAMPPHLPCAHVSSDNCIETLFTGRDAHALVIYVTSYAIKGELTTFNMFTILAEDCKRKADLFDEMRKKKKKKEEKVEEMDQEKKEGSSFVMPYKTQLTQFVNSLTGSTELCAVSRPVIRKSRHA